MDGRSRRRRGDRRRRARRRSRVRDRRRAAGRPAAARGDGRGLGLAGPPRRRRARRIGDPRPYARDATSTARRLHFIAIGGAGMSGLALVCHRLGAAVTGSDRAESSYFERVRARGHRRAPRPRRGRRARRRRGGRLDGDRRRQPGAATALASAASG